MNLSDVGKLLNYASAFDKRTVTEMTAVAWHDILGKYDYESAQAAVREFFSTSGHGYLDVTDVLDGIKKRRRLLPSQIEADVRAAKNIGAVDQSWPADEPLPVAAADRLAEYRRETIEMLGWAEPLSIHDRGRDAMDLGQVGHTIPRED